MTDKGMKFKWYWCETCGTAAIECPVCGNNCCNAMYGEDENGNPCRYCTLAYQYQDLGWETDSAPKTPEGCDGVWPKLVIGGCI